MDLGSPSGSTPMESENNRRIRMVQTEVDRVKLLPPSSSYAVHRLRYGGDGDGLGGGGELYTYGGGGDGLGGGGELYTYGGRWGWAWRRWRIVIVWRRWRCAWGGGGGDALGVNRELTFNGGGGGHKLGGGGGGEL
ncbi:hypothetical protein R1sor_016210 [Riccia sorocarpa]|uniref:Uncharacterized protein n=1 Tax=Riccia sorocarpa TaxID=122646 RepID=A0ABD3HGD4_9MARC